jgi:nicotinamidase-related amidase
VNEKGFQAQVIQLARMNGWRVFHPQKMQARDGSWRTALSGDKGWPDLCLAHRERGFIVCELKADKGVLSPEQKEWLFNLAPWAECYVWKPSDLQNIAKRLGAKSIKVMHIPD